MCSSELDSGTKASVFLQFTMMAAAKMAAADNVTNVFFIIKSP
jgi:hypothetical protein